MVVGGQCTNYRDGASCVSHSSLYNSPSHPQTHYTHSPIANYVTLIIPPQPHIVHAKAIPRPRQRIKLPMTSRRINRNCMDSHRLQILVKTIPSTLSPHPLNNIIHVRIYPHPSQFHHSGKDTPRLRGVW